MVHSDAQPPSAFSGAHLVLYDGVCGLCSRLLQFVLRHDRRRVFRFASLQSAVGRSFLEKSGGNPDQLTTFYVIVGYQTKTPQLLTKSAAMVFVASQLDWPWKVARWMRFVPRAIRDRGYDVVARSRYRVFGRYDRCPIP